MGFVRSLACVVACLAACLSAQTNQTGASRFALATVLDPRGRTSVDVGADDFVVQESGETREVLDVRVADYPIAIVLDTGSSARSDFADMRKSVDRFLEKLGARPVALVTSGGDPKVIATFDDERETVLETLRSLQPSDAADGRPLAGAALAADTIQAVGPLFSTTVILTRSQAESGEAADPLLAPIVDSRTVLHVVARGLLPAGVRVLRGLVDQTRGQFTAIYSAASYLPALDRLAERLNSELLIEYIVPPGSKPLDVKLGVRVPGARVVGLGVAPR